MHQIKDLVTRLVLLALICTVFLPGANAASLISYNGITAVISLDNDEWSYASSIGQAAAYDLALNTIIPILAQTRDDYRSYYDSRPRSLAATMSFEDRIALDIKAHAAARFSNIDKDGQIGFNNWMVTDPVRILDRISNFIAALD